MTIDHQNWAIPENNRTLKTDRLISNLPSTQGFLARFGDLWPKDFLKILYFVPSAIWIFPCHFDLRTTDFFYEFEFKRPSTHGFLKKSDQIFEIMHQEKWKQDTRWRFFLIFLFWPSEILCILAFVTLDQRIIWNLTELRPTDFLKWCFLQWTLDPRISKNC